MWVWNGLDLWVGMHGGMLVCLDVCLTMYGLHDYLQLYVFTMYIPPLSPTCLYSCICMMS